jgi:large subunit ribosomal protein L19e
MNLSKKKQLAAKTLKVGKNRIIFNQNSTAEIKEAITKQDIKTLFEEGIISIKPIKGRRKLIRRTRRKGPGKIKNKINYRKQVYVKLVRKLRKYLKELKIKNEITLELYKELRKKIKMKAFRSRAHLREYLENLKKLKEKQDGSQVQNSKNPKGSKNAAKVGNQTKKKEKKQ